MNNLVQELKTIVASVRGERLPLEATRIRLKEVLHIFVLDCIYNSSFRALVFYGGTALRILYELPRLSEDLDFEADKRQDLEKLARMLEEYFSRDIQLRVQVIGLTL